MKYLPCLLFLLLLVAAPVHAKDEAPVKAAPYFSPSVIDVKELLGPYPDAAETKAEIETILKDQASIAQDKDILARIDREARHLNVDLFDTVFGDWFKQKDFPAIDVLFQRVGVTIKPMISQAKDIWNRPRPPLVDPQVKPLVELPKSGAYPSGHSTTGNLYALILAEMAPADQKEAILARGKEIGDDRILAGVHYPSDVAAGEKFAQAIFAKLMADPAFTADLAKAKKELLAAEQKNKKP